jgi:DNA polymerase-3 subunit alpha
VGGAAVDAILAAREDGPFESVFDLCRRVDLRRVNKRTLDGIVCAGALDEVSGGRDRATIRAALDPAVEQGQGAQRDRASGQRGLFDVLGESQTLYREDYPTVEEWTPKELLRHEREALGFYLTGHPLDRFRHDIERFATASIGDLGGRRAGNDVVLGGVICELREVQTRSGRGPMAFFQLEDQSGRIETVVLAKTYAEREDEDEASPTIGDQLHRAGDEPVLVKGRLEVDRDLEGEVQGFKLLMESVREVAEVRKEKTRGVRVRLSDDQLTADKIQALQQIVFEHSGSCTMELQVTVPDRYTGTVILGNEFGVTPHEPLLFALERLFGKGTAALL